MCTVCRNHTNTRVESAQVTEIFMRTTDYFRIFQRSLMTHSSVKHEVNGNIHNQTHQPTAKKDVERQDRNLEVEIQFFDFFSLFLCLNAQVTKKCN